MGEGPLGFFVHTFRAKRPWFVGHHCTISLGSLPVTSLAQGPECPSACVPIANCPAAGVVFSRNQFMPSVVLVLASLDGMCVCVCAKVMTLMACTVCRLSIVLLVSSFKQDCSGSDITQLD